MNRITIVGIGDDGWDGLTSHAKSIIQRAESVLGPPALLQTLPESGAVRVASEAGLDTLRSQIESLPPGPAVVLAGGDPLFYGVARFLTESFGKDRFEVVPNVSSMQLAFARVKESWDDAYLTNLATTPLDRAIESIRIAESAGLFPTEAASPALIATSLLDRRIDYFTAYVCENLGTPDETVTQGDLRSIAGQSFSSMCVMVLVRRPSSADIRDASGGVGLFGNDDAAFLQSRPKRGLLTPSEVRSIAMGEMALRRDSVVWDIGAGSGSLAIECAMVAENGAVYAIEMDAEDYDLMIQNAANFDVPSLHPIQGRAPDAFAELPPPDAIFIGGTGRAVPELVAASVRRLKTRGRIVVNVGSPDNLIAVQHRIEATGRTTDVRMINIARGNYQLERVRFEAINPTFLVLGRGDSN